MSDTTIAKLGGLLMILSGAANVVFWAMAWTVGSFVGADSALNPLWAPAQWLHVVAAASGALGLVALCSMLRPRFGSAGIISLFIALVGAMCYFADGVIALTLYPILAKEAPALLAATGAMNVPPMLFAFIAFSAIFMIGHVALSGVFLWRHAFPTAATIMFALGAILFNLPPGPVPEHIIQFGGIVFGLGAAWIGLAAALGSIPGGVSTADQR